MGDFIIHDMRVQVSNKDMELFFRTHELLCSKELYTRYELKSIFDRPFREARERMIESEALAPRRTGYGTNFQINEMTKGRTYNDQFGNTKSIGTAKMPQVQEFTSFEEDFKREHDPHGILKHTHTQ